MIEATPIGLITLSVILIPAAFLGLWWLAKIALEWLNYDR